MSQTTVEDILERIAKLPDEDRLLLEQRLTDILEGEWQRGAIQARQEAKGRGIDQASIDQAVRDIRHPQ